MRLTFVSDSHFFVPFKMFLQKKRGKKERILFLIVHSRRFTQTSEQFFISRLKRKIVSFHFYTTLNFECSYYRI